MEEDPIFFLPVYPFCLQLRDKWVFLFFSLSEKGALLDEIINPFPLIHQLALPLPFPSLLYPPIICTQPKSDVSRTCACGVIGA